LASVSPDAVKGCSVDMHTPNHFRVAYRAIGTPVRRSAMTEPRLCCDYVLGDWSENGMRMRA